MLLATIFFTSLAAFAYGVYRIQVTPLNSLYDNTWTLTDALVLGGLLGVIGSAVVGFVW